MRRTDWQRHVHGFPTESAPRSATRVAHLHPLTQSVEDPLRGDPGEGPLSSWEWAWIDLGGEG